MILQENIAFIKDLLITSSAATIEGVIATKFRQRTLIAFLLGGMTVALGVRGIVTELVEVRTLTSLGITFLSSSLGV